MHRAKDVLSFLGGKATFSLPRGAETSRPGNPSTGQSFTGGNSPHQGPVYREMPWVPLVALEKPTPRALGHPLTWGEGDLARAAGAADRRGSLTLQGAQRARGPGAAPPFRSPRQAWVGSAGPGWFRLRPIGLRLAGRARGRVRRPGGSGEELGLPPRPDAHALFQTVHPGYTVCTPNTKPRTLYPIAEV